MTLGLAPRAAHVFPTCRFSSAVLILVEGWEKENLFTHKALITESIVFKRFKPFFWAA